MAASLHLILLNVVQVDIRGGHAAHAHFLYEQRKLFCSNRGKKKREQTLEIQENYILSLAHLYLDSLRQTFQSHAAAVLEKET